ncbi:MAG: hypothetical protein LBB36_04735, partial [Fibromonadaceae bacterium]|nr:hypothetical protein [Fibromonadaceae bacterium]
MRTHSSTRKGERFFVPTTIRSLARQWLATLAILAAFAPMAAMAQTVTVTDFAGLQAAITAYRSATDDVIIEVGESLTSTSTLGLTIYENTSGKTLTIRSADPVNPVTLTPISDYSLFNIYPDAKLIMENIIIDGGRIIVNGSFLMKDGTKIINSPEVGVSVSAYASNPIFTMEGGEISRNKGGVSVGGGSFIMTGGKISGNTATGNGGGVYVSGSGTLTFGGTAVISGNTNNSGETSNVYLSYDKYITLIT